jgi:hypothetical protein
MAISEHLVYFLKNGKFQNIEFGITRKELVELIGKPDFTLPLKSRNPMLYEYDNIEFYFEDESENAKLKTIQVDYPIKYSKEGNITFNGYDWTIELTLNQAEEFLNKHNINFEEKPYPFDFDSWRLLVTEGNTEIHFTNQDDENIWQLHSFGRTFKFD